MKSFALLLIAGARAGADEPRPIPPERFDELRRMILPRDGEQRFWRIPWKLGVGEAREEAAREGKPIFVWAGAGGAPIGVC